MPTCYKMLLVRMSPASSSIATHPCQRCLACEYFGVQSNCAPKYITIASCHAPDDLPRCKTETRRAWPTGFQYTSILIRARAGQSKALVSPKPQRHGSFRTALPFLGGCLGTRKLYCKLNYLGKLLYAGRTLECTVWVFQSTIRTTGGGGSKHSQLTLGFEASPVPSRQWETPRLRLLHRRKPGSTDQKQRRGARPLLKR